MKIKQVCERVAGLIVDVKRGRDTAMATAVVQEVVPPVACGTEKQHRAPDSDQVTDNVVFLPF